MVFRLSVHLRLVALGADAVARRPQLQTVGLVTVAADHPGLMHAALDKGAVDKDLVADLPIVVIQRLFGQRQAVGVQQGLAVVVGTEIAAPGVTAATAVDLGIGRQWCRAPGNRRLLAEGPVAALGQRGRETAVGLLVGAVFPHQLQVPRAGAVTGLAADVDLAEAGNKAATAGVVTLVQVGAVALRAAGIPVHVGAGPVQGVAVVGHLLRIEMEPALAAVLRGPCVPGDIEGLQAAAGQRQQVLLQGFDTKGVAYREVLQGTVFAGGVDDEIVAVAGEGCGYPAAGEGGTVEITEYRVSCGLLHGQVMVRVLPQLVFGPVTVGTALTADKLVGTGLAGQQQQ